jgi:hypothetical protein
VECFFMGGMKVEFKFGGVLLKAKA